MLVVILDTLQHKFSIMFDIAPWYVVYFMGLHGVTCSGFNPDRGNYFVIVNCSAICVHEVL